MHLHETMSKLLQFFIDQGQVGDQTILSPASVLRMERAESTNAEAVRQHAGYGLNNYSSSYKNWVYRGHDGAVVGGRTEFAYWAQAKRGHVIMTNSDDHETFKAFSVFIRDYETRT